MTDFGAPGSANEPRAGKRPRSSMAPIIASEAGRPIDVTGGAGGSRIIMGSLFSVFNRIEYGLPLNQAVDAERVDANEFPDKGIKVEDARLAPGVLDVAEGPRPPAGPAGRVRHAPARAGRGLPRARRAGPRTPCRTRAPTTARWPSAARRCVEYQTTSMPRASQRRAPAYSRPALAITRREAAFSGWAIEMTSSAPTSSRQNRSAARAPSVA